MKRAVIACLLTMAALSMTGCPIYPSDSRCHSHWDCAPGYGCDEATGVCVAPAPACVRPADCTGEKETCAPDGSCQVGTCRLVGCIAGYSCTIFEGTWTCTQGMSGAGGTSSNGGASAVGGSGTSSDAGIGNSATEGGSSNGGGTQTAGANSTGGGATSAAGAVGTGGAEASAGASS